MKYVVPWMLFVASVITAAPWLARQFGHDWLPNPSDRAPFWAVVAMAWLVFPSSWACWRSSTLLLSKKVTLRVDQ